MAGNDKSVVCNQRAAGVVLITGDTSRWSRALAADGQESGKGGRIPALRLDAGVERYAPPPCRAKPTSRRAPGW